MTDYSHEKADVRMNNLFLNTSAYWARYSEYEYRKGRDDIL